jgi:predicted XRE-type DNA-binding protein
MRKAKGEKPHVTAGNVLDDLGFDPQTALELKLKSELHMGILQLIRKRGYSPRDLERILTVQQPRVSELLRGKLNLLSVSKLLLYADQLGGQAKVIVRSKKAAAQGGFVS